MAIASMRSAAGSSSSAQIGPRIPALVHEPFELAASVDPTCSILPGSGIGDVEQDSLGAGALEGVDRSFDCLGPSRATITRRPRLAARRSPRNRPEQTARHEDAACLEALTRSPCPVA
jgi:hypothetical protein